MKSKAKAMIAKKLAGEEKKETLKDQVKEVAEKAKTTPPPPVQDTAKYGEPVAAVAVTVVDPLSAKAAQKAAHGQ